jgi:hypothetical protein
MLETFINKLTKKRRFLARVNIERMLLLIHLAQIDLIAVGTSDPFLTLKHFLSATAVHPSN